MTLYATETDLGQRMFAHAELGDRRRSKRLAETFSRMIHHPGGTLPDKLSAPADLKALYRLCSCEAVTHERCIEAIRRFTLAAIAEHDGPVLVVHDATELDYTSNVSLADVLGQIGNGSRRGYICQNVLAIDPATGRVLGLLDQVLHRRDRVRKSETLPELRERATRESLLWLIGAEELPADWKLVDVADRGASTFEFIEHEANSKRRFVIRECHSRCIRPGHDGERDDEDAEKRYLKPYVQGLGELGRYAIDVRAHQGRKARENVELAVRGGAITLLPPHMKRGLHGDDPLPLYVVYVSETGEPPAGEEPIEWLLLTNEPIKSFEDAKRVVGWYKQRWIIEEYHKAMKMGCRIQDLQFTSTDRLEPAIALLSAVALTLLNLREASRRPDAHERKATSVIAPDYIEVLSLWRHRDVRPDWSVHEFFYALARLGGHQNRRGDHPPGWLVLWRGWEKLQAMLDGYHARKPKCG